VLNFTYLLNQRCVLLQQAGGGGGGGVHCAKTIEDLSDGMVTGTGQLLFVGFRTKMAISVGLHGIILSNL